MLHIRNWSPQASRILFASGLVLMGLTLFPLLFSMIQPAQSPEQQSLRAYLRSVQAGGDYDLKEAVARVRAGTIHSEGRAVRVTENWLQYALGRVYPPLGRSQNAERLIAGRETDCSERSLILKAISEAAGKRCRFVGLGGHVALEVQVADNWVLADPDYNVVYQAGLSELEDPAAEPSIRHKVAEQGHTPARIQNYVAILQSRGDNITLPIGMPLSPRLYVAEVACEWLIWIFPLVCLLLGTALRARLASAPTRKVSARPHPSTARRKVGMPVLIGGALKH